MRRTVQIVFLLVLLMCTKNVLAQKSGIGIGIIIGEPTGVSGKKWVSSNAAFNAAAAWSFVGDGALHLHVDYVFHNFDLFAPDIKNLALYYGIGGRVKLSDNSKFGMRIPVGLNYIVQDQPFDLFFELIPVLDLAPATDFSINGAIGFRFFFQ